MDENRSKGRLRTVLAGIALLWIGGCTIDKINAPSWDVRLIIPLFQKTYTLLELAEKDDDLVIDQGRLFFHVRDTLPLFEVGPYLSMEGGGDRIRLAIPPQVSPGFEMTVLDTLVLSDEMVIQRAVIGEGTFRVIAENPSALHVELTLSVPSIRHDDIPFFMRVEPYTDEERSIHDLSGARITPPVVDGRNHIPVSIHLRLLSGWTEWGETLSLALSLTDLVFDEVTGWLHDISAPLDAVETALDLPEELEGLRVGPLELWIGVDNEAGFSGRVEYTVLGKKENTHPVALHGTGTLLAGQRSSFRLTGMEQIINVYPDIIAFSGRVLLGGDDEPATVKKTDRIGADWFLAIPMIFAFDRQENRTGPDTLRLSESIRKNIRNHVGEGYLCLEAINHLPIGADLLIILSKHPDFYEQQRRSDLRKRLTLKSARVRDPGDPTGTISNPLHVVDPVTSTMRFGITEEEIKIFYESEIYWGVRISYPGSEGFIEVLGDDYISITAWLDFMAIVRTPDDAGGN
ncbi:MAG TPA: hypothetical protein ENN17_09855 [bacterium]|nr:hypothetical protein [bacterium]